MIKNSRGGSLTEEHSLFHERYHYKGGNIGGGISYCFALMDGLRRMGGAVVGNPRHSVYGNNVLDIRRMACSELAPKNTESYFLSKIIWWLKKNTECEKVLSFADLSAGHKGTIYKAANFKKIGETEPSMHVEWNGKLYHPRSLSIDREYSYKMREDLKTGKAKLVKGLPKSIWIYEIKSY